MHIECSRFIPTQNIEIKMQQIQITDPSIQNFKT